MRSFSVTLLSPGCDDHSASEMLKSVTKQTHLLQTRWESEPSMSAGPDSHSVFVHVHCGLIYQRSY